MGRGVVWLHVSRFNGTGIFVSADVLPAGHLTSFRFVDLNCLVYDSAFASVLDSRRDRCVPRRSMLKVWAQERLHLLILGYSYVGFVYLHEV